MSATHSIALQRCWHHEQREAVCRCMACQRSYCRECVTEHEERFLCTACLAAASEKAVVPSSWNGTLGTVLRLTAALLVLNLVFFSCGWLLQVLRR